MESKEIFEAAKSGNLQNALFTTADKVSQGAQDVFGGVYSSVRDNTANVLKGLPAAATATQNSVQNAAGAAGSFLTKCETGVVPFFFYYNPFRNNENSYQ